MYLFWSIMSNQISLTKIAWVFSILITIFIGFLNCPICISSTYILSITYAFFYHSVTIYVKYAWKEKNPNGFSSYSVEKNSAQTSTASTNFSRDHFHARILARLRAQLQSPTTHVTDRGSWRKTHIVEVPTPAGTIECARGVIFCS